MGDMSVKGLRTLPEYLGSVIRRDALYRTGHFVLAGWLEAAKSIFCKLQAVAM